MTLKAPDIDEEDMQMIYNWVDEIPLSRPKKNIGRDFADGGKRMVTWSVTCRDHSSLFSDDCWIAQLFECKWKIVETV